MTQVREFPAERRTDLACLIRHPVGFRLDEGSVLRNPSCGPMFDFDDPDTRRADRDDVDLVGLEPMRGGERQIRQQHPCPIPGFGHQSRLDVRESFPFAFVDGRPAATQGDLHPFLRIDPRRVVGDYGLGRGCTRSTPAGNANRNSPSSRSSTRSMWLKRSRVVLPSGSVTVACRMSNVALSTSTSR